MERFLPRVGIRDAHPPERWEILRDLFPEVSEQEVRAKLTPAGPVGTALYILAGWL